MTDLCHTCAQLIDAVNSSRPWQVGLEDEEEEDDATSVPNSAERVLAVRKLQDHMVEAKERFDAYKADTATAQAGWTTLKTKRLGTTANSVDETAMFSFDYAQQVLLPIQVQQVGK